MNMQKDQRKIKSIDALATPNFCALPGSSGESKATLRNAPVKKSTMAWIVNPARRDLIRPQRSMTRACITLVHYHKPKIRKRHTAAIVPPTPHSELQNPDIQADFSVEKPATANRFPEYVVMAMMPLHISICIKKKPIQARRPR